MEKKVDESDEIALEILNAVIHLAERINGNLEGSAIKLIVPSDALK